MMIRSILLGLTLATAAQAGSLEAPTAFEIYPALASICLHDRPASTFAATGTDNGTLTGTASIQGYVCQLRVHSGRGSGIRIFSACADVTWDLSGNVLTVTPVANASGYSIQCD